MNRMVGPRIKIITAYVALVAMWAVVAILSAMHVAPVVIIALCAAVIAVMAVFGLRMLPLLATATQRRRLLLFAERNPNPVLALSADGRVLYANAGAGDMLRDLGTAVDEPAALLPSDLGKRLSALRALPEGRQVWEYPKDKHVLACSVHYLPDLGEFHAYIADITRHSRVEARLSHQAHHDTLTGLPNRRRFQEHIEQALAAGPGRRQRLAVILMDLDRFNVITRSLGHGVGDGLLQAVTARLEHLLTEERATGTEAMLYRFEADVFALLVSGFTDRHAPLELARRMVSGIQQPLYVNTREYFLTFSVGVSIYPRDGSDSLVLLRNADTAMHRAKQRGGNHFQAYSQDMNARAVESLSLQNYLRHAIEHNELCLNFQPEVETRTGRVIGAEVLLRWKHPERGVIMPSEFIPLAEETGLVVDIGEWTLRAACTQCKTWSNAGLAKLPMAVNISARQFHQQDLPGLVKRVLAEAGIDPPLLELEITEGAAMQDAEHTRAILKQLKDIGVRLSIDDFGTGFSSLSYLRRFPIDHLKIDQSFIRNLTSDEHDAAITRAIIGLAHSLKLTVIAEGVETEAQLSHLRQENCDLVQGYLLYHPLSASALEAILRDHPVAWIAPIGEPA